MAIRLYGDFFVDLAEREALIGLLSRMEALHAWPVREAHELLQQRWRVLDSIEL